MSSFKIGDKVIKITPWGCTNPYWKGKPIHKDEIHTVRGVDDSDATDLCILLEGIANPINPYTGQEYAYMQYEFQKVIEPATGFVEVSFTRVVESEPKICAS